MPKPKTYGSPIGVAGGPSERPSGSQGRQKPVKATDAQVKSVVEKEMSARGRHPVTKSPAISSGKSKASGSDFSRGAEELLHPGRRTKKVIDDMGG